MDHRLAENNERLQEIGKVQGAKSLSSQMRIDQKKGQTQERSIYNAA